MTLSKLDQAAQDAGIAVDFTNASGEQVRIHDDTKRALLAVMNTPQGKAPPLPPVQVFTPRRPRQCCPQGKGEFSWQLETERGKTYSGLLQAGETFTLPGRRPQGYDHETLQQGREQWHSKIIVARGR